MIQMIFKILSLAVIIYTFMCFIRIFLSWFPGGLYSPLGRFLTQTCDPYLNKFHFRFLRFSAFDFSPAVALCVLFVVSSICSGIANNQHTTLGRIFAMLVTMIWGIFSSLLVLLMIIILIRLLVLVFSNNSNSYDSIWSQLDRSLSPIIFKISSVFSGGKPVPLKTALILAFIMLFIIWFGGKILIGYLAAIIESLPI
ncbi:MAG: YggT family protein [Treponema sp.]|nr:YggT family protein [Treponema sp.]